MSLSATAASFVLAATLAQGDSCPTTAEFKPSKQNVRALVTVNGKPAGHLRLQILADSPDRKVSELKVETDADGFFDLKGLPAGQNCFQAIGDGAGPKLVGSLCVDVTLAVDASASAFSLALSSWPPPEPPTMDEIAKQKEKSPIEFTAATLEGAVKDFTGAVIQKADISVYRRNFPGKVDPEKVKTDEEGNFSMSLEAGTYTVVVQMDGFKTRFIGLEIEKDAPKRKISIELDIAQVCLVN
jgi:Carboxypeptidase regulatory-like domain